MVNIQALLKNLSQQPDNPELVQELQQALIQLEANAQQSVLIQGYFALAYAYQVQEQWQLAISYYQKVLSLNFQTARLHNNLANCLQRVGRLNEALTHLENALSLESHPQVLNNMASIYWELGKVDEARVLYYEALKLQPSSPSVLANLGKLYREYDQWDLAVNIYLKLIDIEPTVVNYHFLGQAYIHLKQYESALPYYQKSLQKNPCNLQTHYHLGNLYINLNKSELARRHFEYILEKGFSPEVQFKHLFAFPPIPDSMEHLQQIRQRFLDELEQLKQRRLKVSNPLDNFPHSYFLFNYHGLDDRQIQESLFEFFHQAYPDLNYIAPFIQNYKFSQQRPIKLGIISENLYHYSIGKFFKGVLAQLDKTQFELILFNFRSRDDQVSKFVKKQAHQVIEVPRKLVKVREIIAEAQLDILFYPDIGIEPFTYFLAYSRLAPIQCMTWGHGTTSGLPTIDYFISSEALETANSQQYYREHLLILKHLLPFYEKPVVSGSLKSRQAFGLSEEWHLYFCPQSIFKLHPEFDVILQGILQSDPAGHIILLEPQAQIKQWKEALTHRFQRVMPEEFSRIHFLPRQSEEDYLNLVAVVDVVLDPLHLSGGVSGYDCLAVGTPIITCPSQFLRGRITSACYQQMGVDDCIVESPEEYIQLAIKLARQPQKRQQIQTKILSNLNKLYENPAGVRELERYFNQLIEQYRDSRAQI